MSSGDAVDPISHAVVGRITTLAAWPAASTRGAAAASVLGALSPDVDFVLMRAGWDIYLRAHAIGTHSLAGALLTGLGSAAIVKVASRQSPFAALAGAAVMGAWSHVFADIVSGGQLQPAWPLSSVVPFAPLTAMGDPWTIALLVGGIALTWGWRTRRRTAARVALGLLLAFLCVKGTLLAAALTRTTFDGPPPDQATSLVEAQWGSLTAWHLFDRAAGQLRHWTIDARSETARLVLAQTTPQEGPLVRASRSLGTVRNFLAVHALTFAVERPAAGAGRAAQSSARSGLAASSRRTGRPCASRCTWERGCRSGRRAPRRRAPDLTG
jgi:membrane-bound metal-dependent hydrolase YbcI (DUF457 family)